jgi:hypothetical protein
MNAYEEAPGIDLPDERVAVCGDWHGNLQWVSTLTRALTSLAPDVKTILQVGDWWMDPAASDRVFAEAGIERVIVTLGNHEPWSEISPLLDAHPGAAVRVSEITWLLPRPARIRIGDRDILSLGGATSVDREWRTEGYDWWPDEEITDAHVAAAIAGGPADIMITHESPARTPIRAVREVLRVNPHGFPETARLASAVSRARVSEVWDAVRPPLLMHGHMHLPAIGATEAARRVVSLGCDGQQGHLALLDLRALAVNIPDIPAQTHGTER